MRSRVRNRASYAEVNIDPRWDTLQGFIENQHAGRPYEPGLCLCRSGDVGDYSPENCRWDTKSANVRERWAVRPSYDADQELSACLAEALRRLDEGASTQAWRNRMDECEVHERLLHK
jgi:hypothetical protein